MLPAERQQAVADYARFHSLAQTVQWLAEAGVKSNNTSVCRFLQSFVKASPPISEVLLDVVLESAQPLRLVVTQHDERVKLQFAQTAAKI